MYTQQIHSIRNGKNKLVNIMKMTKQEWWIWMNELDQFFRYQREFKLFHEIYIRTNNMYFNS